MRTFDADCIDHGKKGNRQGYHQINRRGFYFLHREVYADHRGLTSDDLSGLAVRHRCDNPRCIQPAHLEVGSWADNNRDRAARGRSAKQRPDLRCLSEDTANTIRALYVKGSRTYGTVALARQFGVDHVTIWNIVHRRYY